jgi:hypothetical protein
VERVKQIQGCVHWKSILKEPLLKEPVSNTNVWGKSIDRKSILKEPLLKEPVSNTNVWAKKWLFENRFPVNAAMVIFTFLRVRLRLFRCSKKWREIFKYQ